MNDVLVFVGARGGQGTTTVAATTALHAAHRAPTALLCADPLAAAALLGAEPVLPGDQAVIAPRLTLGGLDGPHAPITVIDAGPVSTAAPAPAGARTLAVVRGPCYLALHTLLAQEEFRPDGVVVVAEAGRAISEVDVARIVAAPVVASVAVRPEVARMVDAGELLTGATTEPELTPLRTLVDQLVPELGHRRQVDLRPPGRPLRIVVPTPEHSDVLDLEAG